MVRKVREIIGLPEAGTWMTKVISTEDVDPIIKGIKKEIYGFTSAKEHSDALGTLNEVYKGNRLDYPGTPFTRNGTKYYAKIIFSIDNPEELIIPYKENYEGVSPFTGRGFTGAQEIILPEYRFIKGHSFRGGDMINIYNRNGEVVQQFIFDELNDMWKHTK